MRKTIRLTGTPMSKLLPGGREPWFARLVAHTVRMDGTPRSINCRIRQTWSNDDLKAAIWEAVHKRKNPHEFYGDELKLITPLHVTKYLIDPDTRELEIVS